MVIARIGRFTTYRSDNAVSAFCRGDSLATKARLTTKADGAQRNVTGKTLSWRKASEVPGGLLRRDGLLLVILVAFAEMSSLALEFRVTTPALDFRAVINLRDG